MKNSKLQLGLLTLGLSALLGNGGGGSVIRGVVEQSFEEDFRLLRTDRAVFRIRKDALSADEAKLFESVGTNVALKLPPGAIAGAWLMPPRTDRPTPGLERLEAAPPDSIAKREGNFHLAGTMIPSTSSNVGFIQIGGTIFRFNLERLGAREREIFAKSSGKTVIDLPAKALEYAWAAIAPSQSRELSSADASRSEPDFFALEKSWVHARGKVMGSGSPNSGTIQVGGLFLQIDRTALAKNQNALLEKPGSTITLKVPSEAVTLAWTAGGVMTGGELSR